VAVLAGGFVVVAMGRAILAGCVIVGNAYATHKTIVTHSFTCGAFGASSEQRGVRF